MKKIYLFIVSAFLIQASVYSQPCLPDGISFTTQTQIDSFAIYNPNCSEIEGNVSIGGDDITSLDSLGIITSIQGKLLIMNTVTLTSLVGLDNLTSIGGDLFIDGNDTLTSMTGLESLTSIGGAVDISGNNALINMSGLDNLTFIGGALTINSNTVLNNLSGLDKLTSVGEGFGIGANDALISLTGLESLTSIGGGLNIGNWLFGGNPALSSLSGLNNIAAASITNLTIEYNSSLSTCEVQSICDYLASPNGTIVINNNNTGCDSQQEVEDACEALGLNEIKFENEFLLYPNPATNELFIESRNKVKVTGINIYNPIGQIVIKRKGIPERIDISTLNQGVYFVELVTNETKIKKKLIVN